MSECSGFLRFPRRRVVGRALILIAALGMVISACSDGDEVRSASGQRMGDATPTGRANSAERQAEPVAVPHSGDTWIPSSTSYPVGDEGGWVDVAAGHVVLGTGHEVTWASASGYPIRSARGDVWSIQSGPAGVAFQVPENGPLYVAASDGREHIVATDEWPELWTTNGDLITIRRGTPRGADWSILQRSSDGTLENTLASGLTVDAIDARALDEGDGSIWFWTESGGLAHANGRSVSVVASYPRLGFRAAPDIYLLDGGLINLFSDDWHVVVLRRDGEVFARASAPTDGTVAGFGSQTASPDGSRVVYALARMTPPRSTTVYLLRASDTHGTPIYHARGVDWVCAFPPVGWGNGRWMLFRRTDGRTIAVDTDGRRPSQLVDARRALELLGLPTNLTFGPI